MEMDPAAAATRRGDSSPRRRWCRQRSSRLIFPIFVWLHAFRPSSCSVPSDGDSSPLFARFNRDAYLAARGTATAAAGGDRAAEEPIRRDVEIARGGREGERLPRPPDDDPDGCGTYLAPSSIRNSGLGIYTSRPYRKGEMFPFPDIGIVNQDKEHHSPETKQNLLAQYPWALQVLTNGKAEVGYGDVLVPGLGMLANSHLGLVNMRHRDIWRAWPHLDGTDYPFRPDSLTKDDEGRGAHSRHSYVTFEAQVDTEAGEELFVSYGDEWFTAREHLLGIVPGGEHFKEADGLLQQFVLDNEESTDNFALRSANYEKLLREAQLKDSRLRAALPHNLQEVPRAAAVGTARFSAKNSVRTAEWLEENGACIDNIVVGASEIPQAGRGAFAVRAIKKGSRVTTAPVITLDREELHLWGDMERTEDGGGRGELMGDQLLLNYCYSHVNSSLLFFPYSPTVNFINHGDVGISNAEIRWSSMPYHKSEWLNESLEEIKAKMKTGLMFDVVATKNIRRGEEVLLYYGKDWEDSWERHVKEWASMKEADVKNGESHFNFTETLGLATVAELNQMERNMIVKTEEEQQSSPYPYHIMTRCYYAPQENCASDEPSCLRWTFTLDALQLHPCTIMHRKRIEGMDWYDVQVEVPSADSLEVSHHQVTYVPRYAIQFSERPYAGDQYAHGVFRHSIGLPDGIMPTYWLDQEEGKEGGISSLDKLERIESAADNDSESLGEGSDSSSNV